MFGDWVSEREPWKIVAKINKEVITNFKNKIGDIIITNKGASDVGVFNSLQEDKFTFFPKYHQQIFS